MRKLDWGGEHDKWSMEAKYQRWTMKPSRTDASFKMCKNNTHGTATATMPTQ